MKLNLGCGRKSLAGYINIDSDGGVQPDVVRDIERGLPFSDNSVDEIFASHIFEHIKDLVFVMNECFRVLKPGGVMKIIAPYWTSLGAWQDPTHVRSVNENTFRYFCGLMGPDYCGIKCMFALKKQEIRGDELHVELEKPRETASHSSLRADKLFEDQRGTIYKIVFKGKEFILFSTNAGHGRGGDYHESAQHDLVLAGEVEFRQKIGGEMGEEKTQNLGAGDLVKTEASTPHVLISKTDSLVLEWLDGLFEKKYYEPYRRLCR